MELQINIVVIIVIALLVLVVAYFFYVKIRTSGASALESILNIPEFLKKMFGVGS
jgi:Tfp pilus assembly protein PilO